MKTTAKPRPINDDLALAIRKVIGGRLKQTKLGEVWTDERTWREFADEVIMALAGKVTLIDRPTFERIAADAHQMKAVRSYIAEYKARLPDEKRKDGERRQNPYARWAKENMPGEEPK